MEVTACLADSDSVRVSSSIYPSCIRRSGLDVGVARGPAWLFPVWRVSFFVIFEGSYFWYSGS